MICRICQGRFEEESMTGLGKLYCRSCYAKRREFIEMRKQKLQLLQALPLEDKILMSKRLVDEAVSEYGLERVYISYSGGKDSTVLSHLIRQKYPDILHIFSNTTCEYPETMQHVKWEKEHNGMNVHVTKPMDKDGRPWHFKRVVEEHGFPCSRNASPMASGPTGGPRAPEPSRMPWTTLGGISLNMSRIKSITSQIYAAKS